MKRSGIALMLLLIASPSFAQDRNPHWGRPSTPRNGACFYRDGYNSDNFCLETGQSLSSLPTGFNDQITSIQVFGNAQITLFKNTNFGGDHETFSSNVRDLRAIEDSRWNDRISSIRIERGSNAAGRGRDYNQGRQQPSSHKLRCESNYSNRVYCPTDTRGGVRLSNELSSSRCKQGSTWGYDSGRVWVDNGCRADFEVMSRTRAGGGTYVIIPGGTELAIRTNEVIDSKIANAGQKFSANVSSDILDSSNAVAIPRGSDVVLVIRNTEGSDLVLDVASLTVAGKRYVVSTEDLERKGRQGLGANTRTAEMVGGGAAVGAVIGAIVGGGKGAAIGAGVGAAGGAAGQVLTKGKEVRVPAETVLKFKLDADLHLETARS